MAQRKPQGYAGLTALTDAISVYRYIIAGEKRKLRAARGSGTPVRYHRDNNSFSLKLKTKHGAFTYASTKSHASGKIKNRSFRILRMGSDVFFDADSESPHMT